MKPKGLLWPSQGGAFQLQPFHSPFFFFSSFMFGEIKLRETLKQTHLEEEGKRIKTFHSQSAELKCFDLLGVCFFFFPSKPFSSTDIPFQNLLVPRNLIIFLLSFNIFWGNNKKKKPSPCSTQTVLPTGEEMLSILRWSSVASLGGPSRVPLYVTHTGGQSPSVGCRAPGAELGEGHTAPAQHQEGSQVRASSPGSWQVREQSRAINSANCKGNV